MIRHLALAASLLAVNVASAQTAAGTGARTAAPPTAEETDAMQTIAAVLAALHSGDANAALSRLAPTYRIDHTMAQRMVTKHTREGTATAFEQRVASGERVEILDEIVYGPFVVQKQRTTVNGKSSDALWIYEVEDGTVVNLWHFDAAGVLAARKGGR
jgi:hypothetical protein